HIEIIDPSKYRFHGLTLQPRREIPGGYRFFQQPQHLYVSFKRIVYIVSAMTKAHIVKTRPENTSFDQLLLYERLQLQRISGTGIEGYHRTAVVPGAMGVTGDAQVSRYRIITILQQLTLRREIGRHILFDHFMDGRHSRGQRQRLSPKRREEEDLVLEKLHHLPPAGQQRDRHAVGKGLRVASQVRRHPKIFLRPADGDPETGPHLVE